MHHMGNNGKENGKSNAGFETLRHMLPEQAKDFVDTEFSQPAAMAYFATRTDMQRLRNKAENLRNAPPQRMCETAMVMAETIEAHEPDSREYFLTDAKTRGHVFGGSKWRAGWIFIMGSGDHAELAEKFKQKEFSVFAQNGAEIDVADLGPRETAAVYFFQLMVRYAMIWGDIKPGDDHEMSHFLEKDMPGVIVAQGKLTPVEELLLLGLMKMGAPAVVPPDYPWDLGRQVRAQGTDNIIDAAVQFPNLRVKEIQGRIIKLPDFCDHANIKAEFNAATSIGGRDSFLVLKPAQVEEGIEIPGETDLSECTSLGIIIEIGDKKLDVSTSKYIENSAIKGISTIKGLRSERTDEGDFCIHIEKDLRPDANRIAEALQAWVQYEFPYIEKVHIRIITNADEVKKQKACAEEFNKERDKVIQEESDDNVKYFHYCIECQPFSKEHVCIITPDRPPMCGRSRFQIKSAALFGATWHPWKRKEIGDRELRNAIEAVQPLNVETGEYSTINEAVEKLSHGHVKRVQLHSLRGFPHTNCGCFHFLAFWIDSLDGIGIMERNYKGEAPEGITWDKLANTAGGKQAPGIAGVSRAYLRSKHFLRGDGGVEAVRWVSPKAFNALEDLLPDNSTLTG